MPPGVGGSGGAEEMDCGGLTECEGICVDTHHDPANCGACTQTCSAGEVCSQGECDTNCNGGTTLCDGVCVDPNFDPTHCGGCDTACPAGQVCSAGACNAVCLGGTVQCGNLCIDIGLDPANCGNCGNVCAEGEVCSQSQCSLECAGGTTKCGTLCSDTQNDPNNCGGCSVACVAGESCVAGTCKATIFDSCADVLANVPAALNGVYWINPSATQPFQIYCDMTTDGGGWAIVWKNHGGAVGGTISNAQLMAQPNSTLVMPYKQSLGSEMHGQAWTHYVDAANHEWIKIATLWDVNNNVVNDETIRVDMGAVTMADIFNVPVDPCNLASDFMKVYVNGNNFIGQTNLINHYNSTTYGLANSGHGAADDCAQQNSNLINDGSMLVRLDSGNGLNAIRHLFSYEHGAIGRDSSRCMHACWDATSYGGHYEAFMWGVR